MLVALVVLGFLMIGLTQGVRAGLALWDAQTRRVGETAELDATARTLRRLLSGIAPAPPSERERPVVLHAPSSRTRKGTEHVVAACEQLGVELEIVEGLDHREAFERYRNADIIVDQLNAGWYGVFAIEAMALGKPVVTFLHDEAVRRTEEAFGVEVPIVNATKDTLADVLRPLVESPEERRRVGAASRAYVERVHDADAVAARLVDLYAELR